MASILSKLLKREVKQVRRHIMRAAKRGYNMADVSRLTADWITSLDGTMPDRDVYSAMTLTRNRARDLCANDGYAKRFLTLAQHNVVGADGFKLQSKVVENAERGNNKPDYVANKIIEAAWHDFAKRQNCTVDAQLSLRASTQLIVAMLARDGEVFVRLIRGRGKYGLQIQLIEPELVDERLNEELPNGNIVRMGIETDVWRKPVAYHLRKVDSRREAVSGGNVPLIDHERIPADSMLHLFVKERPYQTRGITWMAPVATRMRMLAGYEEAALVNARTGAAKMGFLYSEQGADAYTGDGTDADGNTITEVSAGTIERLPDGLKFQGFEPDFPQSQYADYVKSVLRGVSAGLGVSYNSLAHDLESVNYSSIRAGVLEERETWKSLQLLVIENVMEPLYTAWLEAALLNQSVRLPAAKLDKFNAPEFTGRRWQWVDPLNDTQAAVMQIANGLKTRTEVLAEQGKDFEEQMLTLQNEQQIAADLDVQLAGQAATPTERPPAAQPAGDAEDTDAQG